MILAFNGIKDENIAVVFRQSDTHSPFPYTCPYLLSSSANMRFLPLRFG